MWGTDSIWYGSPQDQIQAFRTFRISQAFQERFGYPEITPELRRKLAYMNNPQPHFKTYGPKNRREFLNFLKLGG